MNSATKHESFWIDSAPGQPYPALQGEVSVDVAVLGGGIAGLTAATLLKRAGRSVAVIEAARVLSGVTGYTTAKVTSSHNLIYADLIKRVGEEGARTYAESNQEAIERIARFVDEYQIDCDFERRSNYVYSESPDGVKDIEDEVAAAQRLGLPASFAASTGLPFPIAGAVRFDNQAQFHPRKYLLRLAETLPGDGSAIFEETRALDVKEGSPNRVVTDKGVVLARDVIVATHYPILNRGVFFPRIHPYREYVVCARIPAEQDPNGMYLNSGTPTRSVRTAPYPGGRLLIVVGDKHRTGEETQTEKHYLALEEFARSRFGIGSFEYRWSTQDNFSLDRLPYIGKLAPGSDHLYVATGFNAWGMTNGTLSGMILADLIMGIANPWAHLFDPNRSGRLFSVQAATQLVQENLSVARHWLGSRVGAPAVDSLAKLAPGEGAVVDVDGKEVAAYRDEQGTVHALSPNCTHMGCLVSWNSAEKSWDCPCHGSRFSTEGTVLHGPAVRDLKKKDL